MGGDAIGAIVQLANDEGDEFRFRFAQMAFLEGATERQQAIEGSGCLGKRRVEIGHHADPVFDGIERRLDVASAISVGKGSDMGHVYSFQRTITEQSGCVPAAGQRGLSASGRCSK